MKFITFTTNKAGYKNKKKMAAYWSNNTAMLSLSGSYISFEVWVSSRPHFENDHSIVILSSFYIIHYYINPGFLLLSSGRLELCPFPSQDHWRLLFINLLFLVCLFLSALPVNCLLTTKRDEIRASRILCICGVQWCICQLISLVISRKVLVASFAGKLL